MEGVFAMAGYGGSGAGGMGKKPNQAKTATRTDRIRLKTWKIFNWRAIPVLLPQLENKSVVPYL